MKSFYNLLTGKKINSNIPRVLLFEPDPIQAEFLAEEIIWGATGQDAEIAYFDSEFSFREGQRLIKNWKPTHAVLATRSLFYSPQDFQQNDIGPDFSGLPEPNDAGYRCRELIGDSIPESRIVALTNPPKIASDQRIPET
jgi:hypothetical protein